MLLNKGCLWEAFVLLPYADKVALLEVLINESSSRGILVNFLLGSKPEETEIPFPLVEVKAALAEEKPAAGTTPALSSTVSIPSPELVKQALAPAAKPAPTPGPPRVIQAPNKRKGRGYSDARPAPAATATLGERLGPDTFKKLSAVVTSGSVN